ncbi:MAG: chloride channel protein [Paludibacteraceae bacterium]|nr:chloride channel protein [Paludibacteraceae bacterium]
MGHTKLTYEHFLTWQQKHISQKNLILLLSLIVGVLSACAAIVLKELIRLIKYLITYQLASGHSHIWYFLGPMIGIALASLFVHYIVKDDINHGITKILYAISQRKSIIKLHNTWSSVIGSALTIGFGGSVGAEAPIVLTGAAIGSNLAKALRLDQKTMMLMIGCGAAGAIGGIFQAPIAGFVFTLEVLMMDLTMSSVAPLLISSVTATAISFLYTHQTSMFTLLCAEPFSMRRIPYYIILGVLCGLVSLYFTRGMNRLEGFFKKHIRSIGVKILVGGSIVGILIFLFPPLYGEGYDVIHALMNGQAMQTLENSPFAYFGLTDWVLIGYLALVLLLKIVASSATNGGGGVGGIFAPSLFMGAVVGFVIARLLNIVGLFVPESNFVLAGMAGLMSGVMHAPLTGIFLIAELTGGYHLFMPLMIVSVVSYLVILLFEPHSLYAMRLAQKGELLTHNKDRSVLTLMHIDQVLERDLTTLQPKMKLGQLIKVIAKSKRNIFPVVDPQGRLMGILLLDEIRNIMFQPRLYERFTVEDLMMLPPAQLTIDMPMEKVMEVFEDTGAWNLPVLDEQKKYLGMISKSKIFNSYRDVLVRLSDE